MSRMLPKAFGKEAASAAACLTKAAEYALAVAFAILEFEAVLGTALCLLAFDSAVYGTE